MSRCPSILQGERCNSRSWAKILKGINSKSQKQLTGCCYCVLGRAATGAGGCRFLGQSTTSITEAEMYLILQVRSGCRTIELQDDSDPSIVSFVYSTTPGSEPQFRQVFNRMQSPEDARIKKVFTC